jgi:hypothetical protein
MKRQIPGLHGETKALPDSLEGLFLVRVVQVNYNGYRQRPFFSIRFVIVEPKNLSSRSICGRIYCTPKALWRLNWFLRDFSYDTDLLGRDEVDERAMVGLKGIIRTSRRTLAGRDQSFLSLDGFAPASEWLTLSSEDVEGTHGEEGSGDIQLHTD